MAGLGSPGVIHDANIIGRDLIEKMAEEILLSVSAEDTGVGELVSFYMGMGSFYFVNSDGNTCHPDSRIKIVADFYTFMEDYDSEFKFTGYPLKLVKENGFIRS